MGDEVFKGKLSNSSKAMLEAIAKRKGLERIAQDELVRIDPLFEFRRRLWDNLKIENTDTTILQHVSIYLSGNREWDRQNLDEKAVNIMNELIKRKKLVFAYDSEKQKEDFIKILEDKGIRQAGLILVDISGCADYSDVKNKVFEKTGPSGIIAVTKSKETYFENGDPNDNIIIANGDVLSGV